MRRAQWKGLWRVSEEAGLVHFVPRVSTTDPQALPLVWAVDMRHPPRDPPEYTSAPEVEVPERVSAYVPAEGLAVGRTTNAFCVPTVSVRSGVEPVQPLQNRLTSTPSAGLSHPV
jgi:hypothetical protein